MDSFFRYVYVRNNFYVSGDGWEKYLIREFESNTSEESIVSECTFVIPFNENYLDETAATNEIRMFSEVKVVDEINGSSKNRFHGFIDSIGPSTDSIAIHVLDPLGMFGKRRYDLKTVSADTIKLGTATQPVQMKPLSEGGETRYVPDWTITANYDAYVNQPPSDPPTNEPRRTWQAIGRLKDWNADTNDYPDYVIPIGYYQIGSDLLNYIEFNGYDPTHGSTVTPDITLDFITVYVEGTNEVEDILIDIVTTAIPNGPGWANTYQFNNTSGLYYTKTIWPSLITINQFTWRYEDGSLLQLIETLLNDFCPPNYKIWWDHEYCQLRAQYVEQTPHSTSTSYYQEGSYAYGGISPDTPPFNNSKVDVEELSKINYPRDEITFASEIVVMGTNEWPDNAAKFDSLTDFGVTTSQSTFETNDKGILLLNQTNAIFYSIPSSIYIPSGWTQYGEPQHLLDMDMETFFGLWWDSSTQPSGDEHWEYHPIYVGGFGAIKHISRIRFWGVNSRREFQFGIRIEVCNDFDITGTTPLLDASWQALNKDLYDREFGPYEEVDVQDGWFIEDYEWFLIWIKPAKIALRGRCAHALTDIQFIESNNVYGKARVIKSGDPDGTWVQNVGTGYDDGYYTLNLPDLFDQLNTPPAHDTNKIVAGHRTPFYENLSLTNTNTCALEAARILMETVRDKKQLGIRCKLSLNLALYKTIKSYNPQTDGTTECFVNNFEVTDEWFGDLDCTSYTASAWTGETPLSIP